MTCMHDRDEQCFRDCPRCARYKYQPECHMCGGSDYLVRYDNQIICTSCLADKLCDRAGGDIAAFARENKYEFEAFLKDMCDEVGDDNG